MSYGSSTYTVTTVPSQDSVFGHGPSSPVPWLREDPTVCTASPNATAGSAKSNVSESRGSWFNKPLGQQFDDVLTWLPAAVPAAFVFLAAASALGAFDESKEECFVDTNGSRWCTDGSMGRSGRALLPLPDIQSEI